jgi:hypothetical protein
VTNFVLLSKENAMSIAHDRLIDGKQLASSLRYLELRLNPGLAASQFDEKIAEFDKKMQDEGITRNNYKSTIEMAQAIDLADEYRRMNTLCSKLIHPTSWSLFTEDQGNERFIEACRLFFSQGVMYLVMIQGAIVRHVKAHGLKHPE